MSKQKLVDMSGRAYLREVKESKKTLVTNAVSSVGFNIKSVVPVLRNGEFEGAVEFIQGVGHYAVVLVKTTRPTWLPFQPITPKREINSVRKTSITSRFLPIKMGGWQQQILLNENSGKQIEQLRALDINKLFKQGYLITEQSYHTALPIYDLVKS